MGKRGPAADYAIRRGTLPGSPINAGFTVKTVRVFRSPDTYDYTLPTCQVGYAQ